MKRENLFKLGLSSYMSNQGESASANARCAEAVQQWYQQYGPQFNYNVMIGGWQYHIHNDLMEMKEAGKPNQRCAWAFNSVAYYLYCKCNSDEWRGVFRYDYLQNLDNVFLNKAMNDRQEWRYRGRYNRPRENCVEELRQRHYKFSQYSGLDAVSPLHILASMVSQVDPNKDVNKNFRHEYWQNNEFLHYAIQIELQKLTQPIWMLGKVDLHPSIPVTAEQLNEFKDEAKAVYRSFKDKCQEIASTKDPKWKLVMAYSCCDICDLTWGDILKLMAKIAMIIKNEATLKPEVGACAFIQKRKEL